MGTKGNPIIYLLVAAFAALAGCAEQDVLEHRAVFSVYAHLSLDEDRTEDEPGIQISSILEAKQPTKTFVPSATARDIWLRPGEYMAKIERCNQLKGKVYVMKYGTRLGADHLFALSVKAGEEFHMDCTVSPDGAIYVWNMPGRIEVLD